MAEQVIFGKTSKRINSISQTYTPVITTNVLLKEPCSVVAPIFLVKQNYATLRECNYAQYAGFYYYITDVVSVRNKHVEVRCSRDPLASFANDIKNAYAYCLYADKAHCDPYLDDPRMTPDVLLAHDENMGETNLINDENLFSNNGTVIMRTYCDLNLNTSGVVTWAMTFADFNNMIRGMNSVVKNDFNTLTAVEDILKKGFTNIFSNGSWKDHILDCYWVPTNIGKFSGGTSAHVGFGAYESPYEAYVVSNFINLYQRDNIPRQLRQHPDVPYDYMWCRSPKYYHVQLNHPCGSVDISAPELITIPAIYFSFVYNAVTGEYMLTIKTGREHNRIITTATGTLKYDLLAVAKADGDSFASFMTSASEKIVGSTASIMSSGATTVLTANNTTSTSQNKDTDEQEKNTSNGSNTTTKTLTSGISGIFPQSFPKASGGSIALANSVLGLWKDGNNNLNDNFYISYDQSVPKLIAQREYESWASIYGYPCSKWLQLSSVDGYVQCVGVSVAVTGATQDEISTINSNANSGIYIEA